VDLIFDRFYRGANTLDNLVPGTGLGLSIVDVIVRHHDGTIRVLDNEPHGTIFEVRLPVIGDSSENTLAPASIDGTLEA